MKLLKFVFSRDLDTYTKLRIMKLKAKKIFLSITKPLKSNAPPNDEIIAYKYKGFIFYYNKNGIRANLLKSSDMVYDEELSSAIAAELLKTYTPVFLDIGAHAGFMTLDVLSKTPSAKVFAFEPGALQNSLFEKTIKANNLKDKITLYKEALGQKKGTASFICQDNPDADWSMNNGFFDTGRGKGAQKRVTVQVQTVDAWWKSAKKPKVNVVKIDTEGAELWVLNGSVEFLSACKPVIFLEITPLNLHAYPYDAKDILHWLNKHNYSLETCGGVSITYENINNHLKNNENFIAKYSKQMV